MKIVFFIILLSLLCNPSLKSHDMSIDYLSNKEIGKVGVKLYKNKDISAIDYLKVAYEKKQFWVGYYLSEIYISKKDYAKATDYLLTAAKSNCPKSQLKIAQWLFKGYIVQKNIRAGLDWLTKSANSGYYLAQAQLGAYYYKIGDPNSAELYLKPALKSKLFEPKYILFKIYMSQNRQKETIRLLKYILKTENSSVNEKISEIEDDFLVMWENKLEKNPNKIQTLLANNDVFSDIFTVSTLYIRKLDYTKACFWLERLAQQEYIPAINKLKKLSKNNIPEAQFTLGKIYKDKDAKKALKYFKKAKKNNCILAKFYIAKISIDQ